MVSAAQVTSRQTILPLKQQVKQTLKAYFKQLEEAQPTNLYDLVMGQVEPALLETTLKHAEGKQSLAAEILGISRSTLRKKLLQYGLI